MHISKKPLNLSNSEVKQILISIALILLVLLPMLTLTFFTGPITDDFVNTNNLLSQPANSYLEQVAMYSKQVYTNTQGTYFGILMCALTPIIFSLNAFPIVILFFVLAFFASLLFLVRTLFKYIICCSTWSITLWTYLGIIFLMTQFTNPREVFYWYTGIAVYTFPASLAFIAFAFLLKAFAVSTIDKRRTTFYSILCAVFSFLAIGGILFLPALFGLTFLSFTIWAWVKRHPFKKHLTVLFFLCDIFIALNVFAPGYFARAESYTWRTDFSLATVSVYNFQVISEIFAKLPPIAIIATCLLISIPISKAFKNCKLSFSHPFLAVIGGGITIFGVVFPNSYGEGPAITLRYTSAAAWVIAVSSVFIAIYILGYFVKNKGLLFNNISFKYSCIAISLLASCTLVTMKPLISFISLNIPLSYIQQLPQESKAEQARILSEIEVAVENEVVVNRPSVEYIYLMPLNLSEDSSAWENSVLARNYGKKSVSIKPIN